MNTEERDESRPRSEKEIQGINQGNANQEDGRRPYNQGYNRPEGNNYERRPYNRPMRDNRGGYNSYGDNRHAYGDRPSHPRYDNRGGGYNNGGGYGSGRPSYNNHGGRGGYGSHEGGYNSRPAYGGNRPSRQDYGEGPTRAAYSATPDGNVVGDGMRKRRQRVGERANSMYEQRNNYGAGRPSYGNIRGGGNNNNNNRPQQRRTNNYNPNAKYNFQKQLKYKEVLADPNEPIRLNKFLANAGVCSRREADEYITAGAVKVNDVVVTELGTKITRQDKVEFGGKQVQIESKVYIVLNKPKNCVTTSDDPQERLTVMKLVKNACQERIYPVGRLDRNTTGVLLLTNDGDLAAKLTHPAFKKKKIYHVWLDKDVAVEDMEKIAEGIELEDGEIHADAISYASEDDKKQVGIEIHSGRNRIVRRIFETLGYRVVKLDRVYFAGLTKKNIGRGKWRYLDEHEVNALRMGAFE